MFTHLTIGTNDLESARQFYDEVLSVLGYQRIVDKETASIWGGQAPRFVVLKPLDGSPASIGNGLTIGFAAPSRAAVDEFYRRALTAGGVDAGAPGPRAAAPNAYAAYVRDLDGHKIVASCFEA